MKTRLFLAVVTVALLAAPARLTAQAVAAQVTLQIPVNLTQFGPDVAKVKVFCSIRSDAITTEAWQPGSKTAVKEQEIPVSGGQVSTTVSLVFSFTALDNPVGKMAYPNCVITGWSTSQQTWLNFVPTSTNPSFKTSNGVDLSGAIGTPFTW